MNIINEEQVVLNMKKISKNIQAFKTNKQTKKHVHVFIYYELECKKKSMTIIFVNLMH